MAKETRLIVRVPGDFNEELARYMFLLQDRGVKTCKSEVIIRLARIGYRVEINELDNRSHTEGPFSYEL